MAQGGTAVHELTLFLTKDVWSKRFPAHMYTVSVEGARKRRSNKVDGSTSAASNWLQQLLPSYCAPCAAATSQPADAVYYKVTFSRSSTARTVSVWRQYSDFERLHRALAATDRALAADVHLAPLAGAHTAAAAAAGCGCSSCMRSPCAGGADGKAAADDSATAMEKRKQVLQRYLDSVLINMMQRGVPLASHPPLVDFLQVRFASAPCAAYSVLPLFHPLAMHTHKGARCRLASGRPAHGEGRLRRRQRRG